MKPHVVTDGYPDETGFRSDGDGRDPEDRAGSGFIVLSAYRDFNYAQQACDLGAYAYLLKPIEEDKLQGDHAGRIPDLYGETGERRAL